MTAPTPYVWSKDEANTIKGAWASDNGRLALDVVINNVADMHGNTFDSDPVIAAYLAGRRSVAIDLVRAITIPTEKLAKGDNEPRDVRPISATERSARAAAGQPARR